MTTCDPRGAPRSRRPLLPRDRVLPFLAIYLAFALIVQVVGATPAWGPQSSLEALCAGLFMMLAMTAVLLSRETVGWHRWFWLASGGALVVLGLDEFFEIHESIGLGGPGQADHLKLALWVGAGAAFAVVHWLERPSRLCQVSMATGLLMHTLCMVVEVGDGGYFRLPLSPGAATFLEDLFELLMLSAYLFAFDTILAECAPAELGADDAPEPREPGKAA